MSELQRGGNAPVPNGPITVVARWQVSGQAPGGLDVDCTAYLLAETGKVRGDHDMVFYNQPSGGGGAISLAASPGEARFAVDTARIPTDVARIAFCLTIDGASFASLSAATIGVEGAVSFAPPREGATEAAMILGELYRRGADWKFRAVGQGFDGGLAPLARSFGIVVDDEAPAPAPAPAAPSGAISLEKKIEAKAPHLISLAKTATVTLEKKKLSDSRAQVVLVLDASGSMWSSYHDGDVQQIIDRIVPLAVHFDDDGALDTWIFSDKATRLVPTTLDNVAGYVQREIMVLEQEPDEEEELLDEDDEEWVDQAIFSGNNEPAIIRALTAAYDGSTLPVYVVFVSDGGVYEDDAIKQLICDAASLPIFWQFLGYAGSSYGILKKLDTMKGRVVDNASFFAIDNLKSIRDETLYDKLLGEFPSWLTDARKAGILKS